MEKGTRKKRPELVVPPVPDGLEAVWEVFADLSATRTSNGMGGVSTISFSEIDAYQRLNALSLAPWEVRVLRGLDRIYIEEISRSEDEIGKCFAADNAAKKES